MRVCPVATEHPCFHLGDVVVRRVHPRGDARAQLCLPDGQDESSVHGERCPGDRGAERESQLVLLIPLLRLGGMPASQYPIATDLNRDLVVEA